MKALLALLGRMSLFTQSLRLGLTQIWSNKTRSALTILGIVIAVASVATVVAAITGLRQKVLKDLESFGPDLLIVRPFQPAWRGGKMVDWNKIRFKVDEFDDLMRHCPSVSIMGRVSYSTAVVSKQDLTVEDAMLMGIDPAWHETDRRYVTAGRPFSLVDAEAHRKVCLISNEIQEKLNLDKDPIGQSLILNGLSFTIVGIVEPAPKTMFQGGRTVTEIFIPFTTGMRMEPFNDFTVMVRAKSPEVALEAQAEILFYLRRMRNIGPGEPDTFAVESLKEILDKFNTLALTMTIVAGCIVGISLVVGGVGIMNIMLVSVSERTREIGLRKAVGARPTAIMFQFLVEAVTLCVLGGIVGIIGGELMAFGIAHIPKIQMEHATVPIWAIIVSLGFCSGVGLCFGMWPAIKAARMDPIEALRHE